MKRRDFIKKVGAGSLVAGSALVSGCKGKSQAETKATAVVKTDKPLEWKMVTTWPKNFPGLGTGANFLAEQIEAMSGGRIKIKVYGAGELVPAFEIFDAVSSGTAQMGHGSAYYWKGKKRGFAVFLNGSVWFDCRRDECLAASRWWHGVVDGSL